MANSATHDPLPAFTRATALPREEVPIFINSFNRLDCLQELVSWLRKAGQRRLYVVNNASEYPPLLAYLEQLRAYGIATVLRLEENAGHLALWRYGILNQLKIESEYIYTDPDVVPDGSCPADAIGQLQSILSGNPGIATAGLGLRLDDLPDGYLFKRQAIAWEQQFWLAPAAVGLFLAPIDTTFALYRPNAGHSLGQPAIRTGWPYVASHRGWYIDETALSDEDLFYRRTAARSTSHWSVPDLPDWLAAAAAAQAQRSPQLLLVGPPGAELPGYRTAPAGGQVNLPSASVDGVYVADALERLEGNSSLAAELRRVIKPGGRLVVHTSSIDSRTVRAMLAHEPAWMQGWRVARAVVPGAVAERGSPKAVVDAPRRIDAPFAASMLHLEPCVAPPGRVEPSAEVLSGNLDHWPGFVALDP